LFRDLRKHPSIKFLWAHQEKLLGEYKDKHLRTRDLAVELPTGAGKTLVGLLIAEYRRRANGERTVFCCPTKQLATQVAQQAQKYGVASVLLVGEQKRYDPADFGRYQQAQATAVTTYSAVFNSNPRISDPEVLVADDAHAAEDFVASTWAVRVSRDREAAAFSAIARILADVLPDGVRHDIDMGSKVPAYAKLVDQVSPIAWLDRVKQLREALDVALAESSERYSWRTISDYLSACTIYCSGTLFEIRPVIPPTLTHSPFADAKQRVYMSATLGEDGDLERSFGIRRIERLPVPDGWDKQGTGRRLVLFPTLSKHKAEPESVLTPVCSEAGRCLVLVPDERRRAQWVRYFASTAFRVLGAADVESDMGVFTRSTTKTALIVANRYDGIDLPGDDCRLMVIHDLPTSASLQETYLMSRLNAKSQLRDRVRTRITQALGRCTRDESDYAAVFVFGDQLVKWLCTASNTAGMHPELQAEIAFGSGNSADRSVEDFVDLVGKFLQQGDAWAAADEAIKIQRNASTRTRDSGATKLMDVVPDEVDYQYALWGGNAEDALVSAQRVLAGLEGGSELKPYRSFWHHLAAVAAFVALGVTGKDGYRSKASEHLAYASSTCLGVTWLGRLRMRVGAAESPAAGPELPVGDWYRTIDDLLARWGIHGGNFQKQLETTRADLATTSDAKAFERGLESLGHMVGATAHRWPEKQQGKPDGLWRFGDWTSLVFEAKTDARGDTVSLTDVRQAVTHETTARTDGLIHKGVACETVVVGRQTKLDSAAAVHVGGLFFVAQDDVLSLFDDAARALEQVRAIAAKESDEQVGEEAQRIYQERGVFIPDVLGRLTTRRLIGLPH
jgi:Rad3-related DNA helicase